MLKITIPGKVFLAGEYLALNGEGALTFATSPRFELRVTASPTPSLVAPFHEDSPAGRLYSRFKEKFMNFQLQFNDPYSEQGGWGSSTAQFLGAYALLVGAPLDFSEITDLGIALNQYQNLAWNGKGLRPSGADLIGQLKGGITLFEKQAGKTMRFDFPFQELELRFIQTGHKVRTHEHLLGITEFDSSQLKECFELVKQGLLNHDMESFISGINKYQTELVELGFCCENTQNILKKLSHGPGLVASKGCGALGADVILVVLKKECATDFDKWVETFNFPSIVNTNQLSSGVRIEGNLDLLSFFDCKNLSEVNREIKKCQLLEEKI